MVSLGTVDCNKVICGTDCSTYYILKTPVAGLRQALLAICSPYLLDHPVG